MHSPPVNLKPERVLKEDGEVTIVEVWRQVDGLPREIAGYYVYGGRGDSSVLHATLVAAETEFLRRTWGPA